MTEEKRDQAFDMIVKHTRSVFKGPGYLPVDNVVGEFRPKEMYRKVER